MGSSKLVGDYRCAWHSRVMFGYVDNYSVLGMQFHHFKNCIHFIKYTKSHLGSSVDSWAHRTRKLYYPFDNQLPCLVVRHSHGVKMAARAGGAEAIARTRQSPATANPSA